MHETAGDAGDEQLVGDLELDGVLERLLLEVKHAVELLGLGNGARESVKDEAGEVLLVGCSSPLDAMRRKNLPLK